MPRRSGRHRIGIEARPLVADEQLDAVRRGLAEHEHRRTGAVAGGVAQRLAAGGHELFAGAVERPVADRRELDGDVVLILDRRDHVAQRRHEGVADQLGLAGHPRAQSVFLAPREPRHRHRVMRLTLHQRQRLQDRVVQMGGEPLALAIVRAAGLVAVHAHQHADRHRRPEHDHGGREDQQQRENLGARAMPEVLTGNTDREEGREPDEQHGDRGTSRRSRRAGRPPPRSSASTAPAGVVRARATAEPHRRSATSPPRLPAATGATAPAARRRGAAARPRPGPGTRPRPSRTTTRRTRPRRPGEPRTRSTRACAASSPPPEDRARTHRAAPRARRAPRRARRRRRRRRPASPPTATAPVDRRELPAHGPIPGVGRIR